MKCCQEAGERINSFALVSYIPDPLGSFLDRIRQELVCSCVAQSHVTILPPRPLSVSQADVQRQLVEAIQHFAPFTVSMDKVEVFAATNVIYLGISAGVPELRRMHDNLNQTSFTAAESHVYHPHVTLAQDFGSEKLNDLVTLARDRWAAFDKPRSFEVERVTFVQNTDNNVWLDLSEFPLGDSVLSLRR